MSNGLAIQTTDLTTEQLTLVKSTVAKGATDNELQLFLYRCRHMGLDPLKPGHIHFVKYGQNPGTIIIGVDGFRSKASKTGKHTGTKRGIIRNEAGECIGAWCEVFRSDWDHPAREEVSLIEYNTNKSNWLKMPETMIKKVAEVAALRMAFPDELGGIYSDDEMGQAEDAKETAPRIVTAIPSKAREIKSVRPVYHDLGDYTVPIGKKYMGQKLSEVPIDELVSFIAWLEESSEKQGKPLLGKTLEFVEKVKEYIEQKNDDQSPPEFDINEQVPF